MGSNYISPFVNNQSIIEIETRTKLFQRRHQSPKLRFIVLNYTVEKLRRVERIRNYDVFTFQLNNDDVQPKCDSSGSVNVRRIKFWIFISKILWLIFALCCYHGERKKYALFDQIMWLLFDYVVLMWIRVFVIEVRIQHCGCPRTIQRNCA